MTDVLDYHQINKALRQLGSDTESAESHGTLCGLLCAKGAAGIDIWTKSLTEEAGDDAASQEALELLRAVATATQQMLNSTELDFHLLLPDDDESLAVRTTALGEWCQGFLAGLSMGGVNNFEALPEESAEILSDFGHIADAGRYQLEDENEDELAYSDLEEYVRMSVILVLDDLQPRERARTTLH